MSATFTKESESCFVASIKGIFAYKDLEGIQVQARAAINHSQNVRLLVLMEDFSGWGKEGDWGDLTFMYEYDASIAKIAIVADLKWRDQVLMFLGAGRRQASVKFFASSQEQTAREWLQS
ncbi:STAS/SEC14 domain-containing protein [Planctomycetota bacterium]